MKGAVSTESKNPSLDGVYEHEYKVFFTAGNHDMRSNDGC